MIHGVMGVFRRLLPRNARGENPRAVALIRRVGAAVDWVRGGPVRSMLRSILGHLAWPVASGAYLVGDPRAPVAVCCLTSTELMKPLARLPGVAIAGRVSTPNLGIEKIVLNVTTNPSIRFLLLCGKESAIFHPGQALVSLLRNGVDGSRRITAAVGHFPVLNNTPAARIEIFRRQVELVDRTGELDVSRLAAAVQDLSARAAGPFDAGDITPAEDLADQEVRDEPPSRSFAIIRPGGKREPLAYDPEGFFVIDVDRDRREIVCRQFHTDNTPAHEMRGRSAETMLLGLLREGLISQMSHAGYLGGELAKAESALRLGLRYQQDRPLSRGED